MQAGHLSASWLRRGSDGHHIMVNSFLQHVLPEARHRTWSKIVLTSLPKVFQAIAGDVTGAPAPSGVLLQARRCSSLRACRHSGVGRRFQAHGWTAAGSSRHPERSLSSSTHRSRTTGPPSFCQSWTKLVTSRCGSLWCVPNVWRCCCPKVSDVPTGAADEHQRHSDEFCTPWRSTSMYKTFNVSM